MSSERVTLAKTYLKQRIEEVGDAIKYLEKQYDAWVALTKKHPKAAERLKEMAVQYRRRETRVFMTHKALTPVAAVATGAVSGLAATKAGLYTGRKLGEL